MTRTTAREIAIQLGFAASAAGVSPQLMFERFFDKEYYQSLASEDELYSEYPGEAQLEYTHRLTVLCDEKREEIDEYIQRYSKGWKLSRISKTEVHSAPSSMMKYSKRIKCSAFSSSCSRR